MKVRQLIEELQQFDGEQDVIVRGYEGGFDDADCAVAIDIVKNWNEAWYYGKHEAVDGIRNTDLLENKDKCTAILIS